MPGHILAYLENTARAHGGRTAYAFENGSFDYSTLLRSAKGIGSSLRGLPKGFMGAVLMDVHSAENVKAFFGIVYAGGCYTPLDPALPGERLRMVFDTLRPAVILTDEKCRSIAEACADGVYALVTVPPCGAVSLLPSTSIKP